MSKIKKNKKNRIYGDIPTAVIYARYSCDKQTEQSIEGQMEVCEKYAEQKGLKVIKTYIDRAMTGRNDDRPHFLQMIADSSKGDFDYVIVYKLDRFSRNRYNSAMYKHKLNLNGVTVMSAMEQLSDSPESVMLEAILEAQAEYYSLDLSQKVKRGMACSAAKGNTIGGTTPLGYCYGTDKKLHIVEEEAAIVRIAYQMYADGKGKKEIAVTLNEKGYKTRAGLPFKVSSFERILNNPKYVGDFGYNGEITVENGCPAIISRDLFNRVQKIAGLKKYAPSASRSEHKYLLTGKLFCGECGAAMTGCKGNGRNGGEYYYYSCNNHRYKKTCIKKNENQDFVEWYVTSQTKAFLSDKKFLRQFAESFEKFYETEYGKTELENAESTLSKINMQINNLVNVIATTANQTLVVKLEELETQKEEAQRNVLELRATSKASPKASDVMNWFEQFDFGDENNYEYRKNIISMILNSVYITENSFDIIWNIGKRETVTFAEYKEKDIHEQVFANVKVWLPLLDLNQWHRD